MHYACLALAAVLFTAGCANEAHRQITRFDGSPIEPAALEQATVECQAKARIAGNMTPAGSSYGLGPAIGGITAIGVQQDALTACMAEKGMRVTYGAPSVPATTGSIPQQK
jgi:hypothetical protein